MDTNISRRERKKMKTTADILSAAKHLFEEKRYENVSIEEITEKADVSRSTFFKHFTNKESLLNGIAQEEVDDILFLIEDQLKDLTSYSKKIRLVLNRLLQDAIPYLHLTSRLVFSTIINTKEYPSPFFRINLVLEELIEAGQESNEFSKDFLASNIATLLVGSYYGIIFRWFETGSVPGTSSDLDNMLDIIFKGVAGSIYK